MSDSSAVQLATVPEQKQIKVSEMNPVDIKDLFSDVIATFQVETVNLTSAIESDNKELREELNS